MMPARSPACRASVPPACRAPWQRLLVCDEALLLRLQRWQTPSVTHVMRALSHLGDTASWIAIGLALATSSTDGLRLGLRLGSGAALATLLSQLLKRLCCRPRPDAGLAGFRALADSPDAFSFPSGHTAAAFGVAVALTGEGHGLGLLSLVLASGIGVSRVYLGAHFPLDVAAGALLGLAAGLAARLLVA